MIIKFDKEIIHLRNNHTITLKTITLQDNFLKQFTYSSITNDETLKNETNTVKPSLLAKVQSFMTHQII